MQQRLFFNFRAKRARACCCVVLPFPRPPCSFPQHQPLQPLSDVQTSTLPSTMKSVAFFVALFAATDAWRTVEVPEPSFGSRFTSIKEEADRFSAACRDVLNGEGPTFTIDVSDHSLSDGVGEKNNRLPCCCGLGSTPLFAVLSCRIGQLVFCPSGNTCQRRAAAWAARAGHVCTCVSFACGKRPVISCHVWCLPPQLQRWFANTAGVARQQSTYNNVKQKSCGED